MNVCILNYGSGNVRSVYNMFHTLHEAVKVSNDPGDIRRASHLVLPGVGAFGAAMEKIRATIDLPVLQEAVFEHRVPFLGICVGMQVLAEEGQEHGTHKGLGWISGTVRRLDAGTLCLPHVGWNDFTSVREGDLLLDGIDPATDFYYVHSYYFDVAAPQMVIATCNYGMEFPSVVNRDNIYGVQFHPEKSQHAGIKLLKNFLARS
jgi:imidazole glycerol-phosphate synthase subunit HisH